ncbi:MAG: GntR family transcriptional regulator, transcriptional repressor for pyruvate dehydrogenase complex [Clostridiales bacterium]|nr:GntR family transcriptional regulator, transcriptional repressor for pyruvate dehydrogenase complex [Clostridiales bacterium]
MKAAHYFFITICAASGSGGMEVKMKNILGEIEKTSRSQQIVEKFKQALAEGKLKVGDKLPPERELAHQLNVSRTSLREAIRILSAYGILESNPGEGTFVTDRFTESVFDFLGFSGMLNKEKFKYLLQTRNIIETGSIDIAMEHFNDDMCVNMETLANKLKEETDLEKLGLLDAEFHEMIVEMTQNPILIKIYKMIFKMLLSGTSKVISYPNARQIAIKDHKKIIDYFKNRQKEECKQALQNHLKATEELIEKYFTKE